MAVTQATLSEFATESEPSTSTEPTGPARPLGHQKQFKTSIRQRLANKAREKSRDKFWEHHDRDGYTCPMCRYEARGIDGEFHVHHIDRDWLNTHLFNLVAICYYCHRRTHRLLPRQERLEDWKRGFLRLGDS